VRPPYLGEVKKKNLSKTSVEIMHSSKNSQFVASRAFVPLHQTEVVRLLFGSVGGGRLDRSRWCRYSKRGSA
jgi:hypothetical protein